jgi:hypothetical protein
MEKTGETGLSPFNWTEAVSGDGYVDMNNKPWYVTDAPYVLASHSTGPYTGGRVDIAPIVKGWLDGRWENDGLELRDQDDRSYLNSPDVYGGEYGDGFSWHIASREDTAQGPHLLVIYDTDKLRIDNRTDSSVSMEPGDTRVLTASGGSGSYQWQATAPDGGDVTGALLVSTGSEVTFTAPEVSGLLTVTLTCGDETDRIYIGIGSESGNSQAPFYLPSDTSAEKEARLNDICNDVLEQIGGFGSFTRIDLYEDGSETRIGGTAQEGGGKMLIAAIDSPADLTAGKTISFESLTGLPVSVGITADSVSPEIRQLYVVVVDIGNISPGKASGLFLFELYDANGDPLAGDAVSQLRITIPYDAGVTGTDPLSSWKIVHAPDRDTFFSGDADADIETIPYEDIVVDETNQTLTFDTDHCSVYGVVSSVEAEVGAGGENDSLGGGCFIGTLYRNARRNSP